MLHLALYQPDNPLNTGAAMRLAACLGAGLDIIEPCGFPWNENRIKRSGMDYIESAALTRHSSWDIFADAYKGRRRIILMTTRGAVPYTEFPFRADDILLAGQESSGVPEHVHAAADGRIVIPMQKGMRSLNVINAAAMVLGEALRQTQKIK
jgi:tRNA (cytidine/uridine-2'-O-)-methyltransferase